MCGLITAYSNLCISQTSCPCQNTLPSSLIMINMRLNEEKSNFLKVLLCLNRLTLAAALPFNLLALSRVREGYERCEVNSHMTKMCEPVCTTTARELQSPVFACGAVYGALSAADIAAHVCPCQFEYSGRCGKNRNNQ